MKGQGLNSKLEIKSPPPHTRWVSKGGILYISTLPLHPLYAVVCDLLNNSNDDTESLPDCYSPPPLIKISIQTLVIKFIKLFHLPLLINQII